MKLKGVENMTITEDVKETENKLQSEQDVVYASKGNGLEQLSPKEQYDEIHHKVTALLWVLGCTDI